MKIVEVRNVIVHNDAVVNKTFLKRVPNVNMKEGDKIDITLVDALEDGELLLNASTAIDAKALSKFTFLPRIEIGTLEKW